MAQEQMKTERLILRPWTEDDAPALYKYAQDPAIGPIAGWPPHTSVENSREIIRDILSAPETYAVILKETNEPIGSVGIMFGDGVHSADMEEGDAEIGYWLGVPYWGQGLIPEAVNRLLSRCFEELGIKRVWCGHYDGNTKSRRVMEKCGFKYHHTEEGKTSPLGDIRTEHFTLLTREEWKRKNYHIRPLTEADIPEMQSLFHSTVLFINTKDYTQEEAEDWASCGDSVERWKMHLSNHQFVGAFNTDNKMVGYSSMNKDGYLHSMFVHKDWQGKGIASLLLTEVENMARQFGVTRITSEVSLTARPFFEKQGYSVIKSQKAKANQLELTNFVMQKLL